MLGKAQRVTNAWARVNMDVHGNLMQRFFVCNWYGKIGFELFHPLINLFINKEGLSFRAF